MYSYVSFLYHDHVWSSFGFCMLVNCRLLYYCSRAACGFCQYQELIADMLLQADLYHQAELLLLAVYGFRVNAYPLIPKL
jgi:hypothetical protein